ncbi:hypothetical protein GCM10011387_23220 [Pedobacter quisquiliarum]|uniref:Uncharacterized protein n=1 Tax=Pedobacter quisquiliarum TaxID=1834438 RepID=A0A916UE85_9SPHI|nr:hypothetical protein [Pedobacter quisquiliarum]GGC69167.1 hypothetical protein GCM10011387_23220 [Pedobacter quisquiliarum]
MTSYKFVFLAGIAIVLLWLSAWIFNHYNPYAGILLAVTTVVISIIYLIKQNGKKY